MTGNPRLEDLWGHAKSATDPHEAGQLIAPGELIGSREPDSQEAGCLADMEESSAGGSVDRYKRHLRIDHPARAGRSASF